MSTLYFTEPRTTLGALIAKLPAGLAMHPPPESVARLVRPGVRAFVLTDGVSHLYVWDREDHLAFERFGTNDAVGIINALEPALDVEFVDYCGLRREDW